MLKQAIYAKFTMINIHDHKAFLIFLVGFVTAQAADHVEIYLKDLQKGDGWFIEQAWQKYKPTPVFVRIDGTIPEEYAVIIPKQTLFESVFGISTKTDYTNSTAFSPKETAWWVVKFCFGGGALSYFTIAYFIYRIYRIARKLYTIVGWVNGSTEEESTLEVVERMLFKKKSLEKPTITEHEKFLLKIYHKLNKLLIVLGIRDYFWCEPEFDQLIELHLAQEKNE